MRNFSTRAIGTWLTSRGSAPSATTARWSRVTTIQCPRRSPCQRKVAGRREKNGNAIELLAFQQLLHLAWNGFLDHRSVFAYSSADESEAGGLAAAPLAGDLPAPEGRDCSGAMPPFKPRRTYHSKCRVKGSRHDLTPVPMNANGDVYGHGNAIPTRRRVRESGLATASGAYGLPAVECLESAHHNPRGWHHD